MGSIKSAIKAGAMDSISQISSAVHVDDIVGKAKGVTSRMNIPELQIPDKVKNFRPDFNIDGLDLPNVETGIQGVRDKIDCLASSVSLPSEIGGFELPQIPDIPSVTDSINSQLKDTGLSIKQGLDFGDIKNAVIKQDFMSLVDFNIDMPIDMSSINHVADGTISSIDSFDLSETQSQIDAMTREAGIEDIDISKYF